MYKYLAVVLIATPAFADQRLFDRITAADSVRLVLPEGHCDATVAGRSRDSLSLALKGTTKACGDKGRMVEVLRSDTYDVAERNLRRMRSPAARLVAKAAAFVAVTNSFTLALPSLNRGRSLARVAGAVAVTAALSTRKQTYTVAAERITSQP
jgi:hypothetical protein